MAISNITVSVAGEFGMKKLILLAALAAAPVFAQTTGIIQTNLSAQSFTDTARRTQEQAAASGRALGNLVTPQLTGIVIGTKCGKYSKALITYSNGTEKSFDTISQDDNTQQHIKVLAATSPNTTIIDLGCPQ
jgi:hypothetical protein